MGLTPPGWSIRPAKPFWSNTTGGPTGSCRSHRGRGPGRARQGPWPRRNGHSSSDRARRLPPMGFSPPDHERRRASRARLGPSGRHEDVARGTVPATSCWDYDPLTLSPSGNLLRKSKKSQARGRRLWYRDPSQLAEERTSFALHDARAFLPGRLLFLIYWMRPLIGAIIAVLVYEHLSERLTAHDGV